MQIQTYNIPDHLRGDTWNGINSITITKDGNPLVLTGSTILMQFRKDVDSPVALELSTNNGGIVVTDGVNGIISVPPSLITMQYGTYQYDLQITVSGGFTRTYLRGSWKIVGDISHT